MQNDPMKKRKLVSDCESNHQFSHKPTTIRTRNNDISHDKKHDVNSPSDSNIGSKVGSKIERYITGRIINSVSPPTYKFSRFSRGSIAVIIGAVSCGVLIIITLLEIL